jgi:hypothetical protein
MSVCSMKADINEKRTGAVSLNGGPIHLHYN